jgi:adenylyl cyclase-associated protein
MQGPVQPVRPEDHVLTRLVRRLEAATSRLEDIASSALEGQPPPTTNGVLGVPSTSSGAAAGVSTSQTGTPPPAPTVKEELPQSIEDFDVLIDGDLKTYHELSKAATIGGLLGDQVCCRHQDVW